MPKSEAAQWVETVLLDVFETIVVESATGNGRAMTNEEVERKRERMAQQIAPLLQDEAAVRAAMELGVEKFSVMLRQAYYD